MAAEIKAFPGATGPQKLQLVSKLEGHQDVVNAAVILRGEEGVISISDDKSVDSLSASLLTYSCLSFVFSQNGTHMAQKGSWELLAQRVSHNAG